METFPIVRRRDEQRHGEYRTKRVILEIYDAMAKPEPAAASTRPASTRHRPTRAWRTRRGRSGGVSEYGRRGLRAAEEAPSLSLDANGPALPASASAPPAADPPTAPTPPAPARRSGRRLRSTDRGSALQRPLPATPPAEPPARQRILDLCLGTLRATGPLTAAELADRLRFLVGEVGAGVVKSVLDAEGRELVAHDTASGRYAAR